MLMLGTEADPEVLVNLRRQLGLIWLTCQYFQWLGVQQLAIHIHPLSKTSAA